MTTVSAMVALRILESVAQSRVPVFTKDIPELADVSRASAYRGVQYLCEAGWLILDGSPQTVRPSLRVASLGLLTVNRERVPAAVVPFAIGLTQEYGWPCIVTMYDNGDLVSAFVTERLGGRVNCHPSGVRAPAACTAAGKAVLAFRPDEERLAVVARGVPKVGPLTKTEPAEIAKEIELARRRGYGLAQDELGDDQVAVGFPVFDDTGFAVGGLSIGFTHARPEGFPDLFLEPLGLAAERASLRLGYRPASYVEVP